NRSIEIVYYYNASLLNNNVVYENTNYGIYVHDSGLYATPGTRLINNTIYHAVGPAIRLENNGPDVKLFNNIVVINNGFAIEVIGNTTGFESDFNDLFPAKPAASVGKFLGTPAATLAAWRTVSGRDA